MKSRHTTLIFVFLTLAIALVISWFFLPSLLSSDDDGLEAPEERYVVWERGDICFQLEVADTTRARRQGLSGRASLPDGAGMIFLYNLSGEYGFWMKDMNFPIDIIWLDRRDRVVTVLSDVSPDTYPEVFYPEGSARKVIEVAAGVADELDVKTGDTLNLSTPTTTPPVDCAML